MRVLWVTAAVMQLAAAISAGLHLAVVFMLLEVFVIANGTLVVYEVTHAPRRGADDWIWKARGHRP